MEVEREITFVNENDLILSGKCRGRRRKQWFWFINGESVGQGHEDTDTSEIEDTYESCESDVLSSSNVSSSEVFFFFFLVTPSLSN